MNITVAKKYLNKYIPEIGIIKIIVKMLSHELADIIKNSGLKVQYENIEVNRTTDYDVFDMFCHDYIYKMTLVKHKNIYRMYKILYVNNYLYPNFTKLDVYRSNDNDKYTIDKLIIEIYPILNLNIKISNNYTYILFTNDNRDINKTQITEKIKYYN